MKNDYDHVQSDIDVFSIEVTANHPYSLELFKKSLGELQNEHELLKEEISSLSKEIDQSLSMSLIGLKQTMLEL